MTSNLSAAVPRERQSRGDASAAPPGRPDAWEEVRLCIDRLAALDALPAAQAEDLRHKIAAQRFDLVVVGQFKRGKTSLINALIGDELLPVAVVPLTSVITVLTWGPEVEAAIRFESGEERRIAPGELAAYVTERGNPGNEKRVREAHVRVPARWRTALAGVARLDASDVASPGSPPPFDAVPAFAPTVLPRPALAWLARPWRRRAVRRRLAGSPVRRTIFAALADYFATVQAWRMQALADLRQAFEIRRKRLESVLAARAGTGAQPDDADVRALERDLAQLRRSMAPATGGCDAGPPPSTASPGHAR